MDNFKEILDALIKEGFDQLPDTSPDTGRNYDYRITPYSLNTPLSFKFGSLQHFVSFLEHSRADTSPQKLETLNATFIELGLDPNQFFYVNFFEKDRIVEM